MSYIKAAIFAKVSEEKSITEIKKILPMGKIIKFKPGDVIKYFNNEKIERMGIIMNIENNYIYTIRWNDNRVIYKYYNLYTQF